MSPRCRDDTWRPEDYNVDYTYFANFWGCRVTDCPSFCWFHLSLDAFSVEPEIPARRLITTATVVSCMQVCL